MVFSFRLQNQDTLSPAPFLHTIRYTTRGDRRGQISVDLDHPYRLLFEADDPVPTREDGGLDWNRVVAIVVLGVEDTHD